MNYFIDIFSPQSYEDWSATDKSVAGFTADKENAVSRIRTGDRIACYMKGEMAWIGMLEVTSDETVKSEDADGFTLGKRVKVLQWLAPGKFLSLKEDKVWRQLSFTKDKQVGDGGWTFAVRKSAAPFKEEDGRVLEKLFGIATPQPTPRPTPQPTQQPAGCRESLEVQALLSKIGATLGFQIWLPRNDKAAVAKLYAGAAVTFLDQLPFVNFTDPVLKTVENIDVLWLQKNTIVRAFEVEHTTSVYSGILRMADLLALQPNFNVKLHIVAPDERRGKVLRELARPAFSIFPQGPLSELCSYIAYEGIRKLAADQNLKHFKPEVLEQYEEYAG